jgi:hypothetical protein
MTDVKATLAQARIQQNQADFRNAERSLLLALEAAAQLYSDPALVAETLQMLVAFYRQTRQINEAVAQALWAAELLKKKLGAGNAGLAPVYQTLAELLAEDGQSAESQRYRALAKSCARPA